MLKRTLIAAVAALPLLAIAGYAAAGGQSDLAAVRDATNPYHDIGVARNAGYTTELALFGTTTTCISNGTEGAMGIHMVSSVDGTLDETHPEALLYEKRNDGSFKLAGVEYIVPQSLWDAAHSSPPSLFGQTLKLIPEPNRYGIPPFYEIHAWTEKANPAGDHADFNPRVVCPAAPDRAPAS